MITNEHIEQFIEQAHRYGDAKLMLCSSGNLSWRIGEEALISVLIQRKLQVDAIHQNGVTHGNDIRCALGTHDPRNLGNGQHISFFHAAALNERECVFIHQHPACRNGHALRNGLFPHIYHFGPSLVIKMGKVCHTQPPI